MNHVTRRSLFAGAAAVAASSALPVVAPAQNAPAKGTGIYRYKVGDIDVMQLLDGVRTAPMPDNYVVNASKDSAIQAVAAAYMPAGQVVSPFCPMIISTGGKLVAIDTGNGLAAYAASKGAVGQLRGNMEAAGIDPKQIDIVLITHCHGDHINGLRNADGSLAYPNAEVKVPAAEVAFWTDESNQSKANAANKGNFANYKRVFDGIKVTPFEAGKEVVSGVTAIASPGHTPGHTSFVLASGNKRVLVQADVTTVPALFLRNPEWHMVFDNDGPLAAQTRHKIYEMAMAEKMPVVGYHFPFPAAGYIEKSGNGYQLIPVAWDPNG